MFLFVLSLCVCVCVRVCVCGASVGFCVHAFLPIVLANGVMFVSFLPVVMVMVCCFAQFNFGGRVTEDKRFGLCVQNRRPNARRDTKLVSKHPLQGLSQHTAVLGIK